MNLEVLVEEVSAEHALRVLLPKIVGPDVTFTVRVFQGKADLLKKLPARLAGSAGWAPGAGTKVVVLIDRDDDDCRQLKAQLEAIAAGSGLATPARTTNAGDIDLLLRIAVAELEAWFLGDVPALKAAFPRVPTSLAQRVGFRDPDDVPNTWERLEGVLNRHGYQLGGLRKVETAGAVAAHMNVEDNRSTSFVAFRDGLRRLVGTA